MERNNMSNKMFSMYNARDIFFKHERCVCFGPAQPLDTSSLRNCFDTPRGSLWVLEILSFSNYCRYSLVKIIAILDFTSLYKT